MTRTITLTASQVEAVKVSGISLHSYARMLSILRPGTGNNDVNTIGWGEAIEASRKLVLPEPEFDLDEIHLAQDMLGATDRT